MSYVPTKWQDHITEYPGEYIIEKTPRGTHRISPAGKVIQEGTPQNAEHFNKIEDALAALCSDAIVDAGGFDTIVHLQAYEYKENTLYKFKLSGAIGSVVGSNDCLGIYTVVASNYDPDADANVYDYGLRFINLISGKCGEFNFTTGEYTERGGDSATLKDRVTGEKYSLYISDGELMIEQVAEGGV